MGATGPVTGRVRRAGGILMVQLIAVLVFFVVRVAVWEWRWGENKRSESRTRTD